MDLNDRTLARFWANVHKTPECWLWTGQSGEFFVGKRHLRPARISYALHHGPAPSSLVVHQTCGNARCVNPDHLTLRRRTTVTREFRRPAGDGIIDEVAIERTFQGDAAVGARLTTEEYDELMVRVLARLDAERAILDRQATPSIRQNRNVYIGTEVIDDMWKVQLSKGLGLKFMDGNQYEFNSLRTAASRYRERAAA